MEAAAQHPLIGKAYGVIKNLSYNEEMRLLAQSREKALRDARNREEGARAEGEATVLAKALESARYMLKEGKLQISEVQTFFPYLSGQDIEKLRGEMSA